MKIDKLAAEIKALKAQIAELQAERHDEGEAMFNKLFGGK
jgi:outer membrane murein-binding lipoprotein Lpp